MAINNFIPEVWAQSINQSLRKALVMAPLCSTRWSGEITQAGDTVHILGVTTGSVSSYTKDSTTVSYSSLSDSTTDLVIDQSDYFAFSVEDVDKVQMIPGLMEQAVSDYAYKMADAIDQYILSLADTSGEVGSYVDYNTAGDGPITVSNVLQALGEVVVALDEANVPSEGRWGVVSPAVYNIIQRAEIGTIGTAERWEAREALNVLGLSIFKSNNVPSATSTTDIKNLFGQGDAIAMAQQLNEVEALRLEGKFADGVRGLNLYGAKVVNSDRLVILNADV